MNLGDKCVVAGLDGCVVTGFMQTVEGDFVRVKTTQNEDWHPEDSVKEDGYEIPEPVVGIPAHYSEKEGYVKDANTGALPTVTKIDGKTGEKTVEEAPNAEDVNPPKLDAMNSDAF